MDGRKLAFLLFDYFPFGGLQRDCLRTARLCAERGHQVTVLTRTWQGPRPEGVEVQLFGRQGWTNLSRNRHWIRRLAEERSRFDAWIGFNKLPDLDVYFGSDPCYVARQRRMHPWLHRWSPRFRHFAALERAVFAAGLETRILLLTGHEIPVYQAIYQTEPDRFFVLPPGIQRREVGPEDRATARGAVRRELGLEPDARLLLLVGSGFRVKGLDRAIRALAALPPGLRRESHLVVIGQNRPGAFQAQALRAGVGRQVHFLGGRDDVFRWLLGADLLVHPAYSESAGMILLEALTAGLPVLATDTCGYAFRIVQAEAGSILPSPFDQERCNQELARMLVSPERECWRLQGERYAAREDLYSCHASAVDRIQEVLDRKGGGA